MPRAVVRCVRVFVQASFTYLLHMRSHGAPPPRSRPPSFNLHQMDPPVVSLCDNASDLRVSDHYVCDSIVVVIRSHPCVALDATPYRSVRSGLVFRLPVNISSAAPPPRRRCTCVSVRCFLSSIRCGLSTVVVDDTRPVVLLSHRWYLLA